MSLRPEQLASRLTELDRLVSSMQPELRGSPAEATARFRSDAAALRFHLRPHKEGPPMLVVIGGTGTGKSTLINRLLESTLCAASFRRTFTSGALAVTAKSPAVPDGWLGLEHRQVDPQSLPARGEMGSLGIVACEHPLATAVTLVDTPDLDGDHPAHHAEADRAFRWAEAVVFVVTPEKYQMTELLPYYRLARRYGVPAVFVMNKCEETAVVEDFRQQLANRDHAGAAVFVIPRDDAAYDSPPDANLAALRSLLRTLCHCEIGKLRSQIAPTPSIIRSRAGDVLGRLRDQVLSPLREHRQRIDQILPTLRAMQMSSPGVDASPMTQQLRRRMQEQSILYLMGPERMLQRVRQAPGVLMRLPRSIWDLLSGGSLKLNLPGRSDQRGAVPDFRAILVEQFTIAQSRMEDLLRSNPVGDSLISQSRDDYQRAKIDPSEAGRIAQEEMAELRTWLEERWSRPPRDTMLLQRLLRYLPGGKRLTAWSEAAPYLLALIVAAHGALFGPIDLMIIGGFTLATWLGEKLSNEVTGRTRLANRRMAQRFEKLAREQIERLCVWLDQQAPAASAIDRIDRAAFDISEAME